MTIAVLRRALSPWAIGARRSGATATATLLLLVGLLGMHVLGVGASHHEAATRTATLHAAGSASVADVGVPGSVDGRDAHRAVIGADPSGGRAMTAPSAPCGGGCGSGGEAMAVMACVLALLVAVLAILIRRSWTALAALDAMIRSPRSAPPHAVVAPPDLHVLSISRT